MSKLYSCDICGKITDNIYKVKGIGINTSDFIKFDGDQLIIKDTKNEKKLTIYANNATKK